MHKFIFKNPNFSNQINSFNQINSITKKEFSIFLNNNKNKNIKKTNEKKNLHKYLDFSPTYKTKKFRLIEDLNIEKEKKILTKITNTLTSKVEAAAPAAPEIIPEKIVTETAAENEAKTISENLNLTKSTNFSYPLILSSPVILSVSFLLLHGTFINSELPELMKFIYKSNFIYGSLSFGILFGSRFQEDEKFINSTYQEIKKRFFYLCGILGLSQSLNFIGLPFPVFIGFYAIMYGLLNEIMTNVHPEVNDVFNKTKIILLIIGFVNLCFIYLNYADYRSSLKDASNFEHFFYRFYSTNDDKFESEILENEKCLRSVDYRLFKKSAIDV